MKATVIRTFLGNDGLKNDGDIIDVTEQRFADLERNGLVIGVIGGKMQPRVKTVPLGAQGATAETVDDPTQPRPTGGQTGAEKPASSLEADLPRKKRAYRRRNAAPK